jgi:hypothetical protein
VVRADELLDAEAVVRAMAVMPEHQRLAHTRVQLAQLQDAASAARSLVERHRPRVEQTRLALVEQEAELARLEADVRVRDKRVADFKKDYPDA